MVAKVILAGGTGFIGTALARRWRERGAEVVVLTRSFPRRRGDGVREVRWDARTVGPWAAELSGATLLVNLTGASINCVHTPANRRLILATRLDAVRALGAALAACPAPPAAWVQSSATGYYGERADVRCDETAPPGDSFTAGVCRQWEAAFAAACPPTVRPVVLRIGVVLGRRGGAYPPLARLARWFLGGRAGSGRQGISWILLDDLEEIFLRAGEAPAMRGAYNACAPEPASNAAFMRALRASLHRPWSPPAPAPLVALAARWLLRTDPTLALQGQFAVPARLLAAGFRFRTPRLAAALQALAARD